MKKMLLLFLLVLPLSLLAQQQVTGKITDEKNNPVPFASIQEKGKSNTVIADANGVFSITVQNGNAVLIITSAEFLPQEINVNNQTTINGQLKSSGNLDEVVITAFGVKRDKRSLGYSAQEVKGEDLVQAKQPNVVNALQGKVSGYRSIVVAVRRDKGLLY